MKIKNITYLFFIIIFLSSCSTKKNVVSNKKNYTDSSTTSYTLKSKNNSLDDFANVLGVSKKELNKSLYLYIDEWLAVPHKMGGLTKKGIDCSAFVNNLYLNVFNETLSRTSRGMAEKIKKKYTKDLKEGDLVFFAFNGKNIDHVGVYLHNGKFVHVSTKKGVIISNINDVWYGKYLVKCGTPKK